MGGSHSDIEAPKVPTTFAQTSIAADTQGRPVCRLAVAVKGLDENYTLHCISIELGKGGEQVWSSIRHQLFRSSIAKLVYNWVWECFISTEIGLGRIQEVRRFSQTSVTVA